MATVTTAEREELNRLRRENRVLREEREILAKAAAWFATETQFTRDAPDAPPLFQHLVSQYMHLIHLQHPRPPASRRSLWLGVAHLQR